MYSFTLVLQYTITESSSSQLATRDCPQNWTQIGNSCYTIVTHNNFVGYYHILQAVDDCLSQGAMLATIPDRETESEVYNLIKETMKVRNYLFIYN